jgi:hypothetical protein
MRDAAAAIAGPEPARGGDARCSRGPLANIQTGRSRSSRVYRRVGRTSQRRDVTCPSRTLRRAPPLVGEEARDVTGGTHLSRDAGRRQAVGDGRSALPTQPPDCPAEVPFGSRSPSRDIRSTGIEDQVVERVRTRHRVPGRIERHEELPVPPHALSPRPGRFVHTWKYEESSRKRSRASLT